MKSEHHSDMEMSNQKFFNTSRAHASPIRFPIDKKGWLLDLQHNVNSFPTLDFGLSQTNPSAVMHRTHILFIFYPNRNFAFFKFCWKRLNSICIYMYIELGYGWKFYLIDLHAYDGWLWRWDGLQQVNHTWEYHKRILLNTTKEYFKKSREKYFSNFSNWALKSSFELIYIWA